MARKYNLVFSNNLKNWNKKKINLLVGEWCLKDLKKINNYKYQITKYDREFDKVNYKIGKENQRIYDQLIQDSIENLKEQTGLKLSTPNGSSF